MKKKASEIKQHQNKTGGGPQLEKSLSDIECKILNILGKTFYEGCNIEEKGVSILIFVSFDSFMNKHLVAETCSTEM